MVLQEPELRWLAYPLISMACFSRDTWIKWEPLCLACAFQVEVNREGGQRVQLLIDAVAALVVLSATVGPVCDLQTRSMFSRGRPIMVEWESRGPEVLEHKSYMIPRCPGGGGGASLQDEATRGGLILHP